MEDTDIVAYVESLGGSNTLIEKILTVKNVADQICPEPIVDILISETPSTGTINPSSVWFFSKNFCLESKEILSSKINIDIMSFYRYITRLEITAFNYNFEEAEEQSQLNFEGTIEGVILEMIATSSNCDHLWHLITKYMTPNIYEYDENNEESPEANS